MSHTLFLCCPLMAGDCGMAQLHSHFVLPGEVESYHTGRVHGHPWLWFCTGRLINSQNASKARKRICPSGSVRSIIHLEVSKRNKDRQTGIFTEETQYRLSDRKLFSHSALWMSIHQTERMTL